MSEKKPSTVFNKNSEERRRKRTKFMFVGFLALLIIVAGLVAFLRKREFQISRIVVTDTKSLDPDTVKAVAERFISGNYLVLIPKTNSLLFSKSGMRAYLLDKIPGLEDATVDFSERNVIHVSVVEKKPSYVWCRATECYFIDRTGMIYEPSPVFSDGVFVTFTGTTIPVDDTPLRERFVPAALFTSLTATISAMNEYPFSVVGVDLQPTGDIAIRVNQIKDMVVNSQAQILVTKDTTAQSIIDSMNLLLKNSEFQGKLSTAGATLQYLDFRFPGKIYYKFTQ